VRSFVVVAHTAPLQGGFSLDDLPGGAGRLDVLCRCATEAFLLSHGIRKDVTLHFVIRDQLILDLDGSHLRHLNPDERSTGALVRNALDAAHRQPREAKVVASPGISVRWGGLRDLVEDFRAAGRPLILLDERGEPLRSAELPPAPVFVLSDHKDFTPDEEKILDGAPRVSVGPRVLHGHQCITLVHNELDWREAGWKGGGN